MTLQHLGRVLVFPVVSVCMSVWCPITFIIIRSSLTLRRGGVQRQLSRIMEQTTKNTVILGEVSSQGRCILLCCITIIYNNVVYHNRYIYLLLPNQPNQWLVLHIKISEQKHLWYSWLLFAYMNAKASWGSRMFFLQDMAHCLDFKLRVGKNITSFLKLHLPHGCICYSLRSLTYLALEMVGWKSFSFGKVAFSASKLNFEDAFIYWLCRTFLLSKTNMIPKAPCYGIINHDYPPKV